MIPKIADFGLSRFFKEENSHVTNSPIGTLGYLPPEFIHHRIISNKLDIFSLGVVVIKIIAGPTGYSRSAEMTSEQFVEIVHGNWMTRLQSAASGDLLESYSEQVKRCVEIALSCVEADRQRRPTIGDIVNILTETETLENYHGALIDQMSTCMVKDSGLIDVHPLSAVCATTGEMKISEVILRDGEHGILRSMDVHPTEPWILAAYARRLVIWNYKTQTRMMEHKFYPGLAHSLRMFVSSSVFVCTVRFIVKSTEQLFVVGDDDGYIHVHDCMTMKRVKEFKAHGNDITSFAVHPTQPFMLSASSDYLIKLWNLEKGWECIRTFTGHSFGVNQVKFNPHDANTFASASFDGTVKIWRIYSPTHFTSLNCEEGQKCVDFYPTGGDQQHYMVTGSTNETACMWRIYSPVMGSQLSFGSPNGTARIWDLRTETCIHEIKGLESPCTVGVIGCHPDRPAVLVTASERNGVSLVDSTTYRSERTVHFGLGHVVCFAYIKGIRSLAIAHDHGVAIMGIDEFSKNILPLAR